jgi:hypothetical protein
MESLESARLKILRMSNGDGKQASIALAREQNRNALRRKQYEEQLKNQD